MEDRVGQVWRLWNAEPFVVIGSSQPSRQDVWWNVVSLETARRDVLLEIFSRPWGVPGLLTRVA